MTDRLIREVEIAALTGLSRTARYQMERRGEFPPRRRIGARHVGWLASEVEQWLRGRPRADGRAVPPTGAVDSAT